jgi:phosphatidylinositol 4-kinase type 2
MPKNRTNTGYARLAQTEEDNDVDDLDHEDPFADRPAVSSPGTQYAPVQPSRRNERVKAPRRGSPSNRNRDSFPHRQRSNSGVDIKAINARLERWADEIASKFKIKRGKKSVDEEHLEIQHSVFQAPDWIRPATAEDLATDPTDGEHLSKEEFDDIVESVRVAIEMGTHPKLIAQGSSGSYFARNTEGKTVAVFKPKDEEPYASRNPKWTKWIHRNLFPFGFGRACLIPNLSYVSEAAAYVLDRRLRTNLVPYTDIVSLSSKSFFYDFWDRRQFYRKKKPLPEKIGSFQIFLKGFKDANIFLKEHPWPDQHSSSLRVEGAVRKKKKRRWTEDCRPGGPRDSDDEYEDENGSPGDNDVADRRRLFWTEKLQQNFREQLEKLVILDYIMRNTDRGLDNWMIRINRKTEEATIVAEPPKENGVARQSSPSGMNGQVNGTDEPYRRQQERMMAVSRTGTPLNLPEEEVSVSLGAIDNSLSWPWKHPDAVSRCSLQSILCC